MKSALFALAFLFTASLCFNNLAAGEESAPAPAGLEGVPETVAEVQGKSITRLELIRELVGASGTKALERIVNRILIEQAAAEKHVEVSEQDIEQQFKRDQSELAQTFIRMPWMTANNKLPVEEIIQAQFGMSLADYKHIVVRQRLLSRRCMAREVNPTESDLRKFFERYPELFQHPVKYRASHILITPLNPNDLFLGSRLRSDISQNSKTDYQGWLQKRLQRERDQNIKLGDDNAEEIPAAWAQAKAKAEQLATQLMANPGKWNEYVYAYSQDPMDRARVGKKGARLPTQRERMGLRMAPGDVDWFHKNGPLVREFYEGAKDLKIGQISFPVQTQFGFHIIKMLQIYRPPLVTFAEVHERVREMYIENEIQMLSSSWLALLARRADLKTEKATLWPPRKDSPAARIGLAEPGVEPVTGDPDPTVGTVNGAPVKRSAVWRDLLRSEGEDALRRLINREVVMGILMRVGVAHMEWICANPNNRALQAPPLMPIRIDEDDLQRKLIDDRLDFDALANEKEYANLSFEEYIYKRYGQTPAEYRRAIEAGMVMMSAIRQKVVPRSPEEFERTLRFEFALARPQYSEDEWYEVSHILIVPSGGMFKADADDLLAARATATNLYPQLLAEPDKFGELEDKFNDDGPENKAAHGSLGACYGDRLLLNFPENAQFYNEIARQNLQPGQFTPVLQSARGYHIVRLDKKHPHREAEYTDKGRRKQIEHDFINEQAKYYAEIWMRALNSRAIVKHFYFKPSQSFDEPDVDPVKLPEDNFTLPK